MSVKVDPSKCRGCGLCEEVCPAGAIRVDSVAHVDPAACLDCGACMDECPNGALAMVEAGATSESPGVPVVRRSYEEAPSASTALPAVGYAGFPAVGVPVARPGCGGTPGGGGRRKKGGFGRGAGRGRGRGARRWR